MWIVTVLGKFGYKLSFKFQYQIRFIFKSVYSFVC